MPSQQDIEFQTIDGLTSRGHLYIADTKGPGIVMAPGFNGVKEMLGPPNVAPSFQQAGFTTLVYDPRTTGLSGGEPRNDIDPFKQVDDFSDALTFLGSHPMVDATRIRVWGMSIGGAVAMSCAPFDRRIRFVIAVCPGIEYPSAPSKLGGVLEKIIQDLESQVKGFPPFYIPMLSANGECPVGFNLGIDKEAAIRILKAQDEAIPTRQALAPNHVNRTTIQSYRKLLMWNPVSM